MAILKPEDPTRIGESASEDEKIKNKRHCNKFSRSSSLICVLTMYITFLSGLFSTFDWEFFSSLFGK